MPLISVIIPVYNGEKTISSTIQSVFNQTFSDLELIVINDGSTDSTLRILNGIDDPRLKVFSYPNAGQAVSRNRGINQAIGNYISFIDADDLWTPDKLDAQLKALQDNPQAAVAYSWTDCIDESDQFCRRGSHIGVSGNVYATLFLNDFIESGSNPLIRADALASVGEFDPCLSPTEDWDMWLRLAQRYPFVAVPSVQILYRQLPESASGNIWRMEAVSLQVIERNAAQSPELLGHLKPISLANRYKGLTFKALAGYPERKRSLTAARFFWQAIHYDPSLLGKPVCLKIVVKLAVIILLPSSHAQRVLTKFNRLFNTTTILGYTRLYPSAE